MISASGNDCRTLPLRNIFLLSEPTMSHIPSLSSNLAQHVMRRLL